jgi:protein TonB
MTVKHTFTQRINKLRPIFFQIGLLIALGATLAAFKWTIYGESVEREVYRGKLEESQGIQAINIIDEHKKEIQETKKQEKQPRPDPDKINLVNNNVVLDTVIPDEKKQPDLAALLKGKPVDPNGGRDKTFDSIPDDTPGTWAEVMPSYPGGYIARAKFINKHMQIPYDVLMGAKNITVYTEAIVEKDGRLSNIKVVKNGGYPSAGEAAKKVIEAMPKWSPGYQGIWPVRIRVVIPIKIRIE